jgi:hypothetical protein
MAERPQAEPVNSGKVSTGNVLVGEMATESAAVDVIAPCSTMGVGSLPHRDAATAAEFAWTTTTIPTLPTLPRRSPAEGMIAQALVGIEGVTVGQYGGINVDTQVLERDVPTTVDFLADAFGGYRAFFEAARREPVRVATPVVKWQCVGPVTLGNAFRRVGLAAPVAFSLSLRAVRAHIRAVQRQMEEVFPLARQLVVLDEPALTSPMFDDIGMSSDDLVDLVSGALAVIGHEHLSGVHCCGDLDWPVLFSVGSSVISVPVPSDEALDQLLTHSSRLAEMLKRGGMIAWGVVRTDGPIAQTPERAWRRLSDVWSSLAAAGLDRELLQSHSFFSPACGLGTHTDDVARHVFELLSEVAGRALQQASHAIATPGS